MAERVGGAAPSLVRTVLGGIAVLAAAAVARTAAMLVTAAAVGADVESADPVVRHDGLLIGAGVFAGALVGAAVLALVARPGLRSYLALQRPTARSVLGWLAAGAALAAAFDVAAWLVGRPLVEPQWVDAYQTAPTWLLAVALVATSVFEEVYFRGFLQGGLAATRLGPAGAIVVVALLFALAHFPDDLWRFVDVLSGGLLLGAARRYSRSSIAGMAPHVLGNLKVLVLIELITG